jgi:hypothetical protein
MGSFSLVPWLSPWKSQLLRALLFALLWLALLDFPQEVAGQELDASWMRCLGHFLIHRTPCGVDYVWTYGPLGYFVNVVYQEHLFWWKYAWELCVKFAFTWMLLRWAIVPRAAWIRASYVLVVFLFLPGSLDTLYLFCLLLLGLLPLCDARCRTPWCLVVATVLLAMLSLTKFTFLLVGVWTVVLLAPVLGWRRRAALAVGYPLLLAILWTLLGQALANIPRFLASSWEVARGYGDSMSAEGDPDMLYLAGVALLLFFILLASYFASLLRRRESLLGSILLCVCLFLVWKHGFVRQSSHAPYFFAFLLFAPFAVEGLLAEQTTHFFRIALLTALVAIGIFGRGSIPAADLWLNRLVANGAYVLAPAQRKRDLAQAEEKLAHEWALPELRRWVGEESVDLFSSAQGVVFLNRFNYEPRPLFQSYSAYTPDLLQRNATFYRSEGAPLFVLCRWQPIDGRFPALEDGAALLEIFQRYRLVAQEKGFLLLKRRSDYRVGAVEHPILLQRTIAFDEEVRLDELGSAPKLLSLHLEDTLRGRITKALFRSPTLSLQINTTDGRSHSFRLIQGMVETSFLVDPLIRDHDDLAALYGGQPLPRIHSLSIHVEADARSCFRDPISLIVRSDERLMGTEPAPKSLGN